MPGMFFTSSSPSPYDPHRKHEPPLPDYVRCSSSGNMLLRTFRAKLLHVRQLIAAKLEENGRRWSHYWNFSRSRWPRRAMPKVISRLSRGVSAILIHWFMRCMHSSAMCRMLYISFNMNNLSDRAAHGLRAWFFIKFCLFIGNRTFLVYLVGTNTFENVLSFFNFEVERYLKYGCPSVRSSKKANFSIQKYRNNNFWISLNGKVQTI